MMNELKPRSCETSKHKKTKNILHKKEGKFEI